MVSISSFLCLFLLSNLCLFIDLLVCLQPSTRCIDMGEFKEFCSHNKAFLKLSHKLQTHFRQQILGLEFWVPISRRVQYVKTTGIASFAIASRINMKGELLARQLGDPVVDKSGNPIGMAIIDPTPSAAGVKSIGINMKAHSSSGLLSGVSNRLSGSNHGASSTKKSGGGLSRRPSMGMATQLPASGSDGVNSPQSSRAMSMSSFGGENDSDKQGNDNSVNGVSSRSLISRNSTSKSIKSISSIASDDKEVVVVERNDELFSINK